jgi:hypothetical protein
LEEILDYQTFLESLGCAPAEVKRMVENRARHSFGEPALEYDPTSDDGKEDED